jgi:large subunit ribosomal protein L15
MLNQLKDNEGARKTSKIVGRGIGSGKGKTCGSGQKGQKARTGVSINGFEGGQMPLYQRLPKRGFKSLNRVIVETISVGEINSLIEKGSLKASEVFNREAFASLKKLPNDKKVLVKVLGDGELKHKIQINLDKYSQSASEKIKKAGGEIIA